MNSSPTTRTQYQPLKRICLQCYKQIALLMSLYEYVKRPKLFIRLIKTTGDKLGIKYFIEVCIEIILIPLLFAISYLSRFSERPIDIGLGPEPLISNVYHKRALILQGYTAETFVMEVYFITQSFDYNILEQPIKGCPQSWRNFWNPIYLFIRALFRYRALMMYFHGGSLFPTRFLRTFEPWFYKLAGIKLVVMPYGSDIQYLICSKNLYFRHALISDYPQMHRNQLRVRKNIERWTHYADWVISGCEWVDYMYHWDTLQLAHFSIDLAQWQPVPQETWDSDKRPFRVFHAPNHTAVKGTQSLIQAVEQLKQEGLNIQLVMLRGVPNHEIQKAIATVDLVADQFVIGWYAMFAIEAMAMEKPVLCYLREDLVELYTKAGLIKLDEIPIINTSILNIADSLRWAYHHPDELIQLGQQGRSFVQRHHSLEKIGQDFSDILHQIDIKPQF